MRLRVLGCFIAIVGTVCADRLPLVWPTPNRAFLEGKPYEDYIQPTRSGRIESGLYGCTRNGGHRFHEGIDLKSIERDRAGRSMDPVFAAVPGRIAYVNRVAGNSSYGIYVVLEHEYEDVTFYTLYSHLRSVDPQIKTGLYIEQGAVVGVLGATAGGYTIPESRAHLHFELGLQLNSEFGWWYDQQGYGSKNHHGDWSGINLVGWDPLKFYRLALRGQIDGPRDFLLRQPKALTVRVDYPGVPDFIRRNQGLVTRTAGNKRRGWEIDFSPYGLPLRWREAPESAFAEQTSKIAVVDYDPDLAFKLCRDLLDRRGGGAVPGKDLRRSLELLFGP
ncbi:MAG: M23 family metallopeptidase [Verrucomicrobiota bacterium]